MARIQFDGQVAIVTGAGNGLGRCYALSLGRRGAAVVVNDLGSSVDGHGHSHTAADAVVDEIRAGGGKAVASYESVSSADGGRAIVQTALAAFGQIDILINNAGIIRHRSFTEQTEEDFQLTMATHLGGAFHVTQAAFREMRTRRYGRILFTSSSAGAFGLPWTSVYGAAKAGVLGLMHVLALEGAPHGILCNALLPGALTRMAGMSGEPPAELREIADALSRLNGGLTPEFVAPLALYLVSERCRTTHSIFSAMGGHYSRAFVGLTQGWQGPTDTPATAEDVEAQFDAIQNTGNYFIPSGGVDEIRAIANMR